MEARRTVKKSIAGLALIIVAGAAGFAGAALSAGPARAADWPMFLAAPTHTPLVEKGPALPLSLKWKFDTQRPVLSSPVVYKGKVFAGSYDKSMYALDTTGRLLWSFATEGPVFSTPAVADDAVYFGSKDSNVYALDADTGKLLWKFKADGEIMTSPVVAEGNVYVAGMDL